MVCETFEKYAKIIHVRNFLKKSFENFRKFSRVRGSRTFHNADPHKRFFPPHTRTKILATPIPPINAHIFIFPFIWPKFHLEFEKFQNLTKDCKCFVTNEKLANWINSRKQVVQGCCIAKKPISVQNIDEWACWTEENGHTRFNNSTLL